METADILYRHFAAGLPVEPPSNLDDDRLVNWYDDNDVQTRITCSADGSMVRMTAHAQQAHCAAGGHRWLHVGPDPAVPGSGWGWRQVS